MRLKPRLSRFQSRLSAKPQGFRPPNHSRPVQTPLSTPHHPHHHPYPLPTVCAQGNSRMARRTWLRPSGREQDEGGLRQRRKGTGNGPSPRPHPDGPRRLVRCLNRIYQVPGILTHTLPSLTKDAASSRTKGITQEGNQPPGGGGPGVSCTPGSVPLACKPSPPACSQGFSNTEPEEGEMTSE